MVNCMSCYIISSFRYVNDFGLFSLYRYGVSHSHVGFVLNATYTFMLAIIQLMCMCYYKKSGMPAGVEPLPRTSRYGSGRIPRGMMRRRQEYSSAASLMSSSDAW